jgi:hypothetical protein
MLGDKPGVEGARALGPPCGQNAQHQLRGKIQKCGQRKLLFRKPQINQFQRSYRFVANKGNFVDKEHA